ncbi:MAG: hypothetical protein GX998_01040 [Firmicutes bacterium]|nr:hypothetical protein [Bacillota bacterium]
MQWRDLWEKWWPSRKAERAGVPLTDQQRKLTNCLLILVVAAVMALQFTSTRTSTPAVLPQGAIPVSNQDIQPAAGPTASLRLGFEAELERKLAAILTQIEGVGNVQVMVSLSTGTRLDLAQDVNGDKTITEETDKQGGKRRIVSERRNEKVVIVREGQGAQDRPITLVEHRPVIAGVLVVADGAIEPGIKLRIGRAVETAIDIPAHRISVVARKR